MDAHFEAQLRELLDRQAIWSVLLRYARGIDRWDREMLRSSYWDDAIDDHFSYVGGPDVFIDTTFEHSRQGSTVEHHGLSNHSCELDGEDAHAETYYTYIGGRTDGQHLLSMGRYIDHFQRREGIWKFANRATVIEKNFLLNEFPYDAAILEGSTETGPLHPATRDRSDVSYLRPVRPRRPKRP